MTCWGYSAKGNASIWSCSKLSPLAFLENVLLEFLGDERLVGTLGNFRFESGLDSTSKTCRSPLPSICCTTCETPGSTLWSHTRILADDPSLPPELSRWHAAMIFVLAAIACKTRYPAFIGLS